MKPSETAHHFWLGIPKVLERSFVLREKHDWKAIRGEYRDLCCDSCLKLDEKLALQRGVSPLVKVSSVADFATTADDFTIVSRRVRELFSELAPDAAVYFPIPATEHFILWPTEIVQADPAGPVYHKNHPKGVVARMYSSPCHACGRPSGVTLRPYNGVYRDDQLIIGLQAEGWNANMMYMLHDRIGKSLTAAGIRGWKRTPNAFKL